MPRDGAEEGVGARLEVGRELFFAFDDRFEAGQFFAAPFDHDVVFDRRGVVEVDHHLAGLGGQHFLVESESCFVRGEFERRRGAGTTLGAFGAALDFADGFLFLRAFFRRGFFAADVGGVSGPVPLLGFDLFVGQRQLVLLVFTLFGRVADSEGGGTDDEDREPDDDQGERPTRNFSDLRPTKVTMTAETARTPPQM